MKNDLEKEKWVLPPLADCMKGNDDSKKRTVDDDSDDAEEEDSNADDHSKEEMDEKTNAVFINDLDKLKEHMVIDSSIKAQAEKVLLTIKKCYLLTILVFQCTPTLLPDHIHSSNSNFIEVTMIQFSYESKQLYGSFRLFRVRGSC